MGTRYRFSAYDEDRIRRAVTAEVAARRPGAVVASDLFTLGDVGERASGWGKLTPAETRFIASVVAEAAATREAEAFR